MPTLEKLGLVEKIITTPTQYKATPLKDGSLMLLQERTKEHTILEEKIKLLLRNDKERNIDAMIQEEIAQFVITSERKLLVKRFEKSFLEVTTCEMIFPVAGLNFALFNFFECFKMAIIKSAKIRIITEKIEISPIVSRKLQTLKKNPLFEIRFTASPIDFGIVIFNNKEVNMCISCTPSEVPSLWTNNPQLLKVARIIFEEEWNNAQD
jgi:sugar-specific transcriptional regulator TrmB